MNKPKNWVDPLHKSVNNSKLTLVFSRQLGEVIGGDSLAFECHYQINIMFQQEQTTFLFCHFTLNNG